jgi:hypothetical protein
MILNPVRIAALHQAKMLSLAEEIKANAGGIRQLLVGRTVRRRDDGSEFMVTDTKIRAGSPVVSLFGHRVGSTKRIRIGLVQGVEMVEPQP